MTNIFSFEMGFGFCSDYIACIADVIVLSVDITTEGENFSKMGRKKAANEMERNKQQISLSTLTENKISI